MSLAGAPACAGSGLVCAGLGKRSFSRAIFFADAAAADAAFTEAADAAEIFAVGTLEVPVEAAKAAATVDAAASTDAADAADAAAAGATLFVTADDAASANAGAAATAGSGNAVNAGSTALRPDSHNAPAPANAMATIAAAITPLRLDDAAGVAGSFGKSAAPGAFCGDAAAGTQLGWRQNLAGLH